MCFACACVWSSTINIDLKTWSCSITQEVVIYEMFHVKAFTGKNFVCFKTVIAFVHMNFTVLLSSPAQTEFYIHP